MIGYADEDSSFALELTYNYEVKSYTVGNDFNSITIMSKAVFNAAKAKVDEEAAILIHVVSRGLCMPQPDPGAVCFC